MIRTRIVDGRCRDVSDISGSKKKQGGWNRLQSPVCHVATGEGDIRKVSWGQNVKAPGDCGGDQEGGGGGYGGGELC